MAKTIVEKIFNSHLKDNPFENTYILNLDVVMCHEITTPIAIADLMWRKKDRVFDNTKIKVVIDHVTPAKDTKTAIQHKVLREWAKRHDIKDFFDVGQNGVCHALFPEKGFIRPGYTVIMGDSHTCTHGAFGAFAAGVGTTDLEVGILKGICSFKKPGTFKINLTGELNKGIYAKDIILEIIRRITVNGATNMVMEFTGDFVKKLSMESRMTMSNMAVEAGGTSGIFAPDEITVDYLWEFIKNDYSWKEEALNDYKKWHSDKDAKYDKELDINVSEITEPKCTFEYKPDQVKNISEFKETKVDQVYIGSCTNGRIEDLREAAKIIKDKTINENIRGIVSPATPKIFKQALKEGIISIFMDAGFSVTNPTCGACLGMSNGVLAPDEVAASTTNRNFNGRMGKGGMVHLMSPASAAATALTGKITDPRDFM